MPSSSFCFYCTLTLLTLWFSFTQPLCLDGERSSLLQIKQSFVINQSASSDPRAYSKVDSWKHERDCCLWDGVECKEGSGHVISLDLSSSFLYGFINSTSSLFNLVHLEMLNLADNHFNHSQIPSAINQLSRLTYLNLSFSVFSGQIPSEISKLSNLSFLDLTDHYNEESMLELKRPDLKNLIQNMTKLKVLSLSSVNISSTFPAFLANFSSLTSLHLSGCRLRGYFPVEIFQLPNLRRLDLGFNHLTGELPPFNRSSSLEELIVAANNISGELPASIGELSSLIKLNAYGTNLFGVIPFSIGKLNQLKYLILSENNFWGPIPSSLGNLTQLIDLELYNNRFNSQIPHSFSNLINLETLDLHNSELSGIVNFDMFLSLKNLMVLVLSFNSLSLLIKPSVNETLPQFTVLKLSFCNLSSFPDFLRYQTRLENLQLQGSNIGGQLPQWLMNISRGTSFTPKLAENLTSSLLLLNLKGNSFSGGIPVFAKGCQLLWIDLSDNRLQGKLPRSLKNCEVLEYLDLGNNQLNDGFPYWLGTLPELQILMLRSNGFYGIIGEPQTSLDFPQLRIIDISKNNFTGKLPSKYFQNWKAMKHRSVGLSYMTIKRFTKSGGSVSYYFDATITIKGVNRYYEVINEDLAIVDLSNNCFDGEIPEVIGSLQNLHSLDLSSNNLTGVIPSSLANLTELESLDLSQNMLSGEIPQELTTLNFLQYFNVSHNRLIGPIPQGNQLNTFEATSYEGNLRLCGISLPKCGNSNAPDTSFYSSASEDEQEDSGSPFDFGWEVLVIGYACGFVVGFFIGQIVIARRPSWFAMIFQVRNVQARRKGSMR